MTYAVDTQSACTTLTLPPAPRGPISVGAPQGPLDVFTAKGEFVHRLEKGERALFRPSRLWRIFGLRWTVQVYS
jgi:hypothetical protein